MEMFEAEKQKGNNLYVSITSASLNKSDLKKLKEAEHFYLKSFSFALTNDQKSSVQKNLMMVELKRLLYHGQDLKQKFQQFNSALVRYYEAKSYAVIEDCKPKKWIEDLNNTVVQYFNDVCKSFMNKNYEYQKRVSFLNQFKEIVEDQEDQFKIRISYYILETQEKIIQQFKEQNNYNRAENEFNYYSRNVQDTFINHEKCEVAFMKSEIKRMQENLQLNAEEYDARRLLVQGNKIYQDCLKEKTQQSSYKMIDSEDIWAAIDAFKSLIKNYEGKYLLFEGEAFANLGFIQQEMFGNDSAKFREYIHSAVTLGLTIDPYGNSDWYVKAKNTLKILQKQEIERDQALRDQWREHNKELYEQIQSEKSKGTQSFIKWVLINHKSPNQDANFALTESDYSNMKKTLLRVIRLYHSDKIVNETDHFKNVAREIMFILNHFFEVYK